MKRQDKYPDTKTFHYYNANPRNRLTTDCVVRAICTALERNYEDIVCELAQFQVMTGYASDDPKGYAKYLESKGWVKHQQPRKCDNTKYTGKEFCRMIERVINLPHGSKYDRRIIAHIGSNHIVAIIDGKVNDTWDSTDGCIGNYWTKE